MSSTDPQPEPAREPDATRRDALGGDGHGSAGHSSDGHGSDGHSSAGHGSDVQPEETPPAETSATAGLAEKQPDLPSRRTNGVVYGIVIAVVLLTALVFVGYAVGLFD